MKPSPRWFVAALSITVATAALTIPMRLKAQNQAAQGHHHYKLIDLGGGPGGGIVGPNTGPLNNLGMVLGGTETAPADPFAPNFCFSDCFVDHSVRWFNGHEIELPPLPGAGKNLSSLASSINAEGWSVGQAQNGEVDPATSWPETHAVLWRGNSITDLGSLGGTQGIANAVNDFGQVVGGSATNLPDVFYNDSLSACLVYPATCGSTFSFDSLFFPVTTEVHAFLWQGSHMRDLGTLSGPDGSGSDSTAWMINNLGEIVGWSFTANAATVEPFFWSPADGKMISMGSLGGTYGTPFWLNNKGLATGASNLAGDQTEHPFIWSKATGMHDLLLDCTWCGTFGHPDSMNDAGQVVGYALVAGDPSDSNNLPLAHGFVWTNGVMTDLGPGLAGDESYEAASINSKGQIVGGSDYFDVYGFLWENGGPIVNLNDLVVPGSDLTVVQAAFINDRGEIACDGHLPNGDAHPCLLIPCDENHPGIEGCDYSLADGNVTVDVTQGSNIGSPVTNSPGAAVVQLNRMRGGMLAGSHERLASRFRNALPAVSTAPYDLIASALNTYQIRINWQEASGQNQSGFNIYRCRGCSSPRTEGTKIASVGGTVLNYTDGSSTRPLTETSTYAYQVTAFSGSGESGPSNASSVTTKSELAPTNLTSFAFSRGNDDIVDLRWTNNSADDNGYYVESCAGLTCTNFSLIAQLGANATAYTQYFQFASDVTLRYRVRAHSPGGFSAYSNIRNQALP